MQAQKKNIESILRQYLENKKLKFTAERKIIVEEVYSVTTHFDADELYLRLRQKHNPKISRATVYRTLPLLEDIGLIRKVDFTDKHAPYERVDADRHHEHLICLECGKIIDFYQESLENILDKVAQECGFNHIEHKLEITGYCKKCQEKMIKKDL